MKYYVFYVESCNSKVKKFVSNKEAVAFSLSFTWEYSDKSDDNWVDFIVKGKIKPIDMQWQKAIKELNK